MEVFVGLAVLALLAGLVCLYLERRESRAWEGAEVSQKAEYAEYRIKLRDGRELRGHGQFYWFPSGETAEWNTPYRAGVAIRKFHWDQQQKEEQR